MRWPFWRRKQRERDLEDEIAFDLAAETEDLVRSGTPRAEAERASRRDFGNVALLQEGIRESWGFAALQRLGQDLRYGARVLRNHPLFTAMAVLSLALGIGANTAVFSVMDAILLRALPVPDPGALMIPNWRAAGIPEVVHSHTGSAYREPGGGETSPDFPWPAYELLRDRSSSFSALFAFQDAGQLNLVVQGQAELGGVELVSGNFFSGLEIAPAAGRLLNDNDNHTVSQVAVLSYAYWRDRFAADPAVLGQTIRLNGIPFAVIGVAAPEFFGVHPGYAPVIYAPMSNRPQLARNYGNERETMFVDPHFYWADMMGRLRPGVTRARAEAELSTLFHQFVRDAAANAKERAHLPSLWLEEGGSGMDSLRRQYSKPLWVLFVMVGFILAIACANIANLLLARAASRRREMAVRLSLGASRLRVIRQLLTESLLLALPGGLLGLGVAAGGIRFLLRLMDNSRANLTFHAGIDWRILLITVAVACATGIAFGLAPAFEATRVEITPALKEARTLGPRIRRFGLSRLLIVSQIALSLLLVLGAAIFVRTLANLHAVETGFNPESLLTLNLNASQAGYQGAALNAFYAGIQERLATLPGVRAATVSDTVLISGASHNTGFFLPGVPRQESRNGPSVSYLTVGPSYFDTLQIPILLGRPLDRRDVTGAPLVAVVNEMLAAKYFPGQNPIGRTFRMGASEAGDLTIVGVARNVRYSSLKQAILPMAFLPYQQDIVKRPPIGMTFELRTVGDPLALAHSVRQVVRQMAPQVPITRIMTHVQRIDATITQERTFANLCAAFAALALIIACVGLYGTMAYAVSRRTNEIGIRMALGAKQRSIVWMVLREVFALSAAGLVIGLGCAWSLFSAVRSFVFGMKPGDPSTVLLAAGILAAALILAGWFPATRASRIDPLTALRYE